MIATLNSGLRRVPTWLVYLVGFLPAPLFLYLALTGGLGREPVKALEHELGELALKLFVVVLMVSPLRRFVGLNLLKFRRALGLLTFLYVALHLAVWLFLDVQIMAQVWADILKRPYITIGMAAFVMLLPLAATSNNLSLRRMGTTAWRRLHWLTYPAAILGAVHYVMLVKTWQAEPLIYLTVILVLIASRYVPAPSRKAVSA